MDHQEAYRQFLAATGLPDEDINLARASLLIAASEYPDLDVGSQLAALDSLAAAASARIGDDGDPFYGVNKLSEYLFDEVGLSGNNDDYYDPGTVISTTCSPGASVSRSRCPWCVYWWETGPAFHCRESECPAISWSLIETRLAW